MIKSIDIFDSLPRDCWLNVDSSQLTTNIRCLQKAVQRPILVAVKGNGYGHGYANAAKAFLAAGVRYLAVANYAEAVVLRQSGVTTPIMILGGMLSPEMALSAQAGFEFFVYRPDHIATLRELTKNKDPFRVHIKVDTGMGRLGCLPEEVSSLATALRELSGVTIAGLATHFAKASKPDNEHTNEQIRKFDTTISSLANCGIRPEIIHASNSSGSLYHPKARYDMVRFGIASYGVKPSTIEGCEVPDGVATAMTWYAKLTSTKVLPRGYSISYGGEVVLTQETRVGVIPVGYVDGYRRMPKNVNTVIVQGQVRKVLGRINMDQCIIDLGDMPDLTGTEVVLMGKQGAEEISVYDLAQRWDTNTYSVYSNIATRVPRREING